jgi:RNA polymerase sigma factor (sigma-70 family)
MDIEEYDPDDFTPDDLPTVVGKPTLGFVNALKLPLLTASQEADLAKRIEKGDLKAKDTLIEHNLRLVLLIAHRCYNGEVELEELCGWGIEGLIRAVEKFDYRREKRFSTIAFIWIRSTIERQRKDHGSLIRIPEQHNNITYSSLDGEYETGVNVLSETTSQDPAVIYEEQHEHEGVDVQALLKGLPERNRLVVELLSDGIKGPKRTGTEVAKGMNMTENAVWKMYRASLDKMRSMAIASNMVTA